MIIYYDSDGQVMAYYSNDTTSTVWSDAGYTKAVVPSEYEKQISRDTKVVVSNNAIVDVVASVNPIQPPPPTADRRIDKAFTSTDHDIVIFSAFLELVNRILVLEGSPQINKGQLRDWLKSKLT